jgi:hypothetical protein
LPIQLVERNKKIFPSELQIEAFWGLKTTHFIADNATRVDDQRLSGEENNFCKSFGSKSETKAGPEL